MKASVPKIRLDPLSDRYDRNRFASAVAPLDHYLRREAGQNQPRRVSSCFVPVTSDHPTPIGYSTPAATGIALTERPGALARRLPRYPVVPATLMRRPILDARHHGRGYGEFLPFDAFSRTLRSEIASYAFVVDAKADKPAEFYRRYGFLPLIEGGRRVFVPVAGIAKPFAE